ncbi:beta-galactosidase [Occallatibacter riparius]|uniref:beta-galactosidase n=1 Tax=Occallatibacter riparius TaxID=1002689 RepID=A0A9J7BT89_9BACT|nr:beta-galactosidase [Occallatibacter riparius]UWZ85864.1 beta-galactosidase [Occallatibacter riparius]
MYREQKTQLRKRFLGVSAGLALLTFSLTAQTSGTAPARQPDIDFPTVLYGAAYYNEYMPGDQNERLEKDIALMKAAGLNVVRMGESTWSLWEPEDGKFEYAWMDHIVDAMGKAGIKVILGTPTYSVPAWMAHQHPEILADRIPPGQFGGKAVPATYGMRQNMDTDSPAYRFYAERMIRHIVAHYKDNPTVIGWQIDNETASYDAANPDVFIGFQHHLEKKFGTPENLSKAWFLNYWGENIHTWEDLPTREGAQSTGYKLEWSRWSQMRVTDFLHWQAALVRECAGSRQFITTDYGGMMKRDVNENAVADGLDIVADNIYHFVPQDRFDGATQSIQGDFSRSLKHANYLVTETNAQSTDWTSSYQYPPYDGQLRQNVYTHLSNGASMVEYWHWASIHGNQETYWKGILSHDLEPNRVYAEMSKTAHELQKIGSEIVGLKIKNDVAILWSRDSDNAISFMPFTSSGPQWSFAGPTADYRSLVEQIHRSLYDMNVGSDFVFPDTHDFSQYKVLIIPALYIADDALLQKISDYVKNGGHVVMTFKSGFANENSAVRWVRAPGPLREAAGFSYQEFSNLAQPLALKDDPYHAGTENKVSYWAEFLMPEHAKALATYDHPFFGKWPAITENEFGKGTLLYEGTYLSDTLQSAVLKDALAKAGVKGDYAPAKIHVQHGVNRSGKKIHYYFNYSAAEQTANYPYGAGTNLLDGKTVDHGTALKLGPWDVAIVEEQ